MEIHSFVAEEPRARDVLREAKAGQTGKKPERDCTGLINDLLESGSYAGKTFLEAREGGKLCGVAIYGIEDDDIFVEFICSDCNGTGTLLIQKLTRIARVAKLKFIRLAAVGRAEKFYEKVGFVKDPDFSSGMMLAVPPKAGRRTYRRGRQRKHGSASLRRHKTRRVL